MRKLGIPPENLQPDRYTGPKFSVVPCFEARRRPAVYDRNYSLLSLWRVGPLAPVGDEGEVWQLIRFENNGDATWVRLQTTSGAGDGIQTLTVDDFTAPGVNPVDPSVSGTTTINGDIVANHSIPLETHSRALYEFSIDAQVATDRTGAPANMNDAGMCSFDDASFNVDANGYVTLIGGSGPAVDSVAVDANTVPGTDPVLATAGGLITVIGAVVAQHSVPVETHSRSINSYNIEVQVATDRTGAPGDKLDAGLSSFDDTIFNVDADGYVTFVGGSGSALQEVIVDDSTGPGTNPVETNLGQITALGDSVAQHGVPVETHSRAANTYTTEVQYADTSASSDATKNGLVHLDSEAFTIDADGFVTFNGNITYTETTTVSVDPMVVSTTYFTDNTLAITLNLPATASVGDKICIRRINTGAVTVTQNAGQTIHYNISDTTTGAAGTLASNNRWDSICIECAVEDTDWIITNSSGAWTTA